MAILLVTAREAEASQSTPWSRIAVVYSGTEDAEKKDIHKTPVIHQTSR